MAPTNGIGGRASDLCRNNLITEPVPLVVANQASKGKHDGEIQAVRVVW